MIIKFLVVILMLSIIWGVKKLNYRIVISIFFLLLYNNYENIYNSFINEGSDVLINKNYTSKLDSINLTLNDKISDINKELETRLIKEYLKKDSIENLLLKSEQERNNLIKENTLKNIKIEDINNQLNYRSANIDNIERKIVDNKNSLDNNRDIINDNSFKIGTMSGNIIDNSNKIEKVNGDINKLVDVSDRLITASTANSKEIKRVSSEIDDKEIKTAVSTEYYTVMFSGILYRGRKSIKVRESELHLYNKKSLFDTYVVYIDDKEYFVFARDLNKKDKKKIKKFFKL